MMIHSFVTADLAAERTRTLRAEADAHRLARAALRGRAAAGAAEGTEHPRRWTRPWGRPDVRPA
ncbi:hypothetical protein [Pseudonocardia humida]|nr:hypothetical protein [Pseudonocardia humida]